MRRAALAAAVALAIATAALCLWKLDVVVLLLLLSLAVAAAVKPLADRLEQRGLPRLVALTLVYVGGLALLAALVEIVGNALLVEAPRALDRFLGIYERLAARGSRGGDLWQALVEHAPTAHGVYQQLGAAPSSAVALGAIDVTHSLLDALMVVTLAVILSLYWVSPRLSLPALLHGALPELPAAPMRVARAIATACGEHLRCALAETSLIAVALACAFRILDLQLCALPAAAAALAMLVPFAGPPLAVAAVLVLGLSTSPLMAILSATVAASVLALWRGLVRPRVFPLRSTDAMLVVVMAIVLAIGFGVVGLLLAPLVARIVAIVVRRSFARFGLRPRPLARMAALQGRIAALEVASRGADPTLLALVQRISALTFASGAFLGDGRSRGRSPVAPALAVAPITPLSHPASGGAHEDAPSHFHAH